MSATWDLYRRRSGLVLGFHGCDRSLGEKVLRGEQSLKVSANAYDWLGTGIYFWENNPRRALEFAEEAAKGSPLSKGVIKEPFVVGAVLDLGYCLDLLETDSLDEMTKAYEFYAAASQASGLELAENKGPDRQRRFLDRAVVEAVHHLREKGNLETYDSVRAAFWEGGDLYPGAGFQKQTHIQLAVRNASCIKGYFGVREKHEQLATSTSKPAAKNPARRKTSR